MAVAACPPNTPPVHGVVTFDANVFKALYPEFSTVLAAALNLNFAYAEFILNNTCRSIVVDANKRETLLNVLVAHLTALLQGVNGQPPSGVVGRINSASQGTVSMTAEFLATLNEQWYLQTQWGALFWQLTAQYRTFRYIPAPAQCYGGPGYGPGGRRGY